ncbi:MAG: putative DNA binding domain-containing protein [Herpetosiphonaceae bacterium]|nr:putative DNA binding domain-containing protein [Herpetosiphonaceae bacterium]
MTTAQFSIAELLAAGESTHAAFLRGNARAEELAETLAAFANRSGGYAVLGVGGKVRPRPEGIERVAAEELALLATLLVTPPLVLPLPEVIDYENKALLVIEVPAGLPNVYSVHGKYLEREGSANVPMPAHALRRLLTERGDVGWERQVPEGVTLEDLDPAKIDRYAERVGSMAQDNAREWLFRRGCLERQGTTYVPTNAGLLLFARTVERHFPHCEITVVRYRGLTMGDEFERDDIRETLPEQIRRAERWIADHIRRGSRMVGLERQDWEEYPAGAVREVIVNAVAHRDYTVRGEGIRIALFGDRIECYSPGRLPGHVTLHNLAHERFSRNEVLVQVLSDLGLIERLGYGIDRILQQMDAAGLPPPQFRETAAGFLLALQGRAVAEAQHAGVDTSEWLRQGLNDRQVAALLYLTEHRRITNREYREQQPSVSDETVRRDLADLVERGLLLRIGDRRGTYYILR